MRRSASLASLLALSLVGVTAGCGDGKQTTSAGTAGSAGSAGSGGSGGGTTSASGGSTSTAGAGGTSSGGTAGSGGTTSTTGTGGSGGMTTTSTTGTGGMVIDPVVDCNVQDFVPPADPKATCEVTTPGNAGVILKGTILLPDQIMHKGQVFIDKSGVIACADCDCSGAAGADMAAVVTCANGVISPGLINTHDHITFSQDLPIGANTPVAQGGHGTERYEHRNQWRKGQDGHMKLVAPGGASTAMILLAELRFVMSGATSAAAAGGKAGLLRNVDVKGMAEGLTITVDSDTFPLDDSSGVVDNNPADGCTFGAAPTKASGIVPDNAYLPHISEGIDADSHTEFLCTSTPPPPAGANDIIEPKTAIIHAVALDAKDVSVVQKDTAKIIWSPRSNVDLYGNTAQITLLDTMGVAIALGTDWLPTGSMNLQRELRCADDLNTQYFAGHFKDKQLWQMVTTNASMAVGTDSVLGMIKKGYVGDIAVFNGSTNKDYRAVLSAQPGDTVLVMRGGKVLYGDDAIVDDLRPGCEQMDVCMYSKRACIALDVGAGTTLATLQTAASTGYAMFSCATPPNEPSCVPYRMADYPNGIQAGTDDDGDGAKNAEDNCPTIFNPKRPMDAKQSDLDGDGKGDVCDPCPLDANDACPALDANDVDGDGVPNGEDNCIYKANPDQADGDKDGHGDACDGCPMDPANAGLAPCPAVALPISAIRNPADPMHPMMGQVVTIKDAYVTAIRPLAGASRGFYVQDTSLQPFSGIFIFTGSSSPTVQVGNKVTITGAYSEFNGTSELGTPSVTVQDPGMVLPFMPIDVADPSTIATNGAMAEGYESMLLKIGMVSVVQVNADAANNQDFDEFVVTGNLRVDDLIFDNVVNMGLDNTCAVGKGFQSITGIGGWSFANYKLEPRNANDFVLLAAGDANYCKPFP